MRASSSAVVASILLLASPASAATPPCGADDPGLDCHFEGDDLRNLLVDDRGCQGASCDLQIDVGPISANHSFCPHCRLAVFTLDLGIDLTELKLLGFNKQKIADLQALDAALQDLLDTDPAELQPELGGEDLEAFIASAMATKDKVLAWKGKLETVINLTKKLTAFDFSSVDFDKLAQEIGAKHDSAFRADFNNPNDKKKSNSGLKVYSLDELIEGMVKANVPKAVRDAALSVLSSLPGLPGVFELSGDDDDPLKPASYHGIKTDLTIRQRTYTVSGNNAALFVFTVVNTTPRVLPVLEVGFLADFDVPPLSYDKATEFDPAMGAVLVYDEHPYEDPPIHYWFGVAPALDVGVGPAAPILANWNLDKNMSLTQVASSIEAKRVKFFLWHPDVSGDHDDADGKSEKQGAISLLFPGAVMPGEQRTAAFCMVQGSGGSSAAARADLTVKLSACKAMYAALTPECGNTALELGEGCDDGNTANGDGCSAACEAEICGDGIVVGGEECDDGNTLDSDGCSGQCKTEKCGDGVAQTKEQCDDGNLSNTDGCLTGCKGASCGDGFIRLCDPATQDCGSACGDKSWCITGEVAFVDVPDVVNGNPASGALEPLQGQSLSFTIGFDVLSEALVPGLGFFDGPTRQLTTGPVDVSFAGPQSVAAALTDNLQGQPWRVDLAAGVSAGEASIKGAVLVGPKGPGIVDVFGLELYASAVLPIDDEGVPLLAAAEWTGNATVRRYAGTTTNMTDYASGSGGGDLTQFIPAPGVEACDDGNGNDHDECTTECKLAQCGDGIVQWVLGEFCDPGDAEGPPCTVDCLPIDVAACGDGDLDAGEGCDDGNTLSGDGCSAGCVLEGCGDAVVQAGEECDDGNVLPNDGCAPGCVAEGCGDGVIQPGEACDDGAGNADDGACRPGCVAASCGDGAVGPGEACDDGNVESGDGCTEACAVEVCGDGAAGLGEECDDGNTVAGDGCSQGCVIEFCGDGAPGPGEECDDGNAKEGDGCGKGCLLENKGDCGNGAVGPGEECDDGGNEDGDGCNVLCQLEDPEACGDGVIGPGEQCDDGNTVAGDGCAPGCATEKCGDKKQQPGEQCDDGNTADGDGCSALCQVEQATCGDGTQQLGEQCDDGNTEGGDGCDGACHAEGDVSTLLQTCGDGKLDLGEECDDGGHWEGDGCDEVCQLEAVVCGNGALEPGEECDDGGNEAGDGCDAACEVEGACGNGAVELGEACDDGGTEGGDGCSAKCKAEFCGDYAVQGGEECDAGDLNSDAMPDACREDCTLPRCGDGVADTGECDGAAACAADCGAVAEPEPDAGGVGDTAGEEAQGGCAGCGSAGGGGGGTALAMLLAMVAAVFTRFGRRRSK